ncbi:MAG: group 1 glycosyl transferase [Parcubacteria group bacterium Licking1014_17]|nr:MAG: group 1 glycosyl transferase [Parcubacteria group bacterium Licking1014_17]
MKICLYLEFYHFLGGKFYKKIGTGLLSSYKNQMVILKHLGIEYTDKWDDSCDILQINTPWLKSIWLIKKAKSKGKKVIIWAHVTAEDIRGVFRFSGFLSVLAKIYLKYAYGQADMVFCPSEYTKSLLVAYGLPAEKLRAQSNGVDLKKFYKDEMRGELARRQYSLSGVVIGNIGLAIPRKGINTFLYLAEKFPGNRFMWYGKIYNPLFVKALPKTIPANVNFTGYVDDVLAAFNSLDIFIFPSYEENQGMVILEAAALGLPILVRDIPVYRGWLVHEQNCLKAKNDDEFRICLDRLLKDADLRKRLGEQAQKLAEENSLPVMAAKTMDIYQKLLKP